MAHGECPSVKLVGTCVDESLWYLSPRAVPKCIECPTKPCPRTKCTEIKPGDGACFMRCGTDPAKARECGWEAPYDFSLNPHQRLAPPEEPCVEPGFRIDKNYCKYPNKDFIRDNAMAAIRAVPKVPIPRVADSPHGHTQDWCKSGLARNHVNNRNFGKLPMYMCRVKNRLAMEDYRMRCILAKRGTICEDAGHNMFNKMGMLEMERSKNPLVHQTKFYVKPKTDFIITGCSPMPHPCFMPKGS